MATIKEERLIAISEFNGAEGVSSSLGVEIKPEGFVELVMEKDFGPADSSVIAKFQLRDEKEMLHLAAFLVSAARRSMMRKNADAQRL